MRKAAECVVRFVGAAAPNKGWHDFLLLCGWLLKGAGRASANKQGCKKHDSPQPGRQRRRAQQWQRVACSLLSERGLNETK